METDIKNKITFRYATKKDIKTIAALEPRIFSEPWTEEMVRADVEARISRYILAELDGAVCEAAETAECSVDEADEAGGKTVVGYLGYWLVFDECSINNVGVIPELQGQGVGSLLMDQMISETEGFGARVWILEVRAGNAPAIKLYEKYGFQRIGLRKKYYENGEDAIVMHRYADGIKA